MAHRNTTLSQMLKHIPRHEFQSCVNAHKGDYRTRNFNSWTQFVALLLSHVTQRKSLRDVESCLESNTHLHYHAGIRSVRRSTLSDANKNRSHQIFADFFNVLYRRLSSLSSKRVLNLNGNVTLLDTTWIDLCLTLFPWAKFKGKYAGIRLHTTYDLNRKVPSCITVTNVKVSESVVARNSTLISGSYFVFDRGIIDFKWFNKLDEIQCFFVTRPRSNAVYKVLTKRKTPHNKNILADEDVLLTGRVTKRKYSKPLRRVTFKDPQTGKILIFLTNAFHLAPTTIAQLYKKRWEIELFFKWMKQHFRVKHFLGTSENAVKIQIWIALTAYVLLAYLKHLSRSKLSMLEITRLLQVNIFSMINLLDLFNKKFRRPKQLDPRNQLIFQMLLTGQ